MTCTSIAQKTKPLQTKSLNLFTAYILPTWIDLTILQTLLLGTEVGAFSRLPVAKPLATNILPVGSKDSSFVATNIVYLIPQGVPVISSSLPVPKSTAPQDF
ncbi:hypothetical protein NPIL_473241 [Nephila pilipes]|uniref:Uncharacterized protein n=1 Tax=Nephila pilipes TaxID=299642 RepID=A0A8X6PUP7_NEPPI|nr:hypothetical protein NPIL_473241 [Nephila pilipes]